MQVSKEDFSQIKENYLGLEYYVFRIEAPENVLNYQLQANETPQERLNYYAFQMQKDLQLIVGMDTLQCQLFHLEQNSGIAPYLTFSLGFETPKTQTDRKFYYTDPIFRTEQIELTIKQSAIDAAPSLAL